MKELIQELSKNNLIAGSFYFKGNENLVSFTDKYSVPESRIRRIALVLTQTMDALGGIVFDRYILGGDDKRISIYKINEGYCGIIFQSDIPFRSIDNVYQGVISKLQAVKEKEKEKEKPAKKITKIAKVQETTEVPVKKDKMLDPSVFEKIKEILSQYLGDFTETIFENQMSDLKIDQKSAMFSKVQKMCFSLQKASGMIIGPSFAKEMVDKLLSVISSEE